MSKFWKDYHDLCISPQIEFLKKHWKGYLVIMVLSFSIPYVIRTAIDNLDEINFKKKEEKES